MCKKHPHKNFQWMTEEELNTLDIKNLREDSDKGYILEVDLSYPQYLHDLHNDFPFLCQRKFHLIQKLANY